MTPKERAAMQQALMYLDAIINGDDVKPYELEGTALTLREALEQLNCQCGDKCFPIFSGDIEYCETCGKPTALAEQAEQEPVARLSIQALLKMYDEEDGDWCKIARAVERHYAAPLASQDTHATHVVRTKDLTDDEIADIVYEMNGNEPTAPFWRDLARAVIAADREKNK